MNDSELEQMLIGATAMALYQYNVSPGRRAELLHTYFQGECAEPEDLLRWVDHPAWATQMPYATAKVYMKMALGRYHREAAERVRMEEHGW